MKGVEDSQTHRAGLSYAELCTTSNFTFLTGASHPEELVTRAAELGLAAIAITDKNSLAGVVRAFSALKELKREAEEAIQIRSHHRMRFLLAPRSRSLASHRETCRLTPAQTDCRQPSGLAGQHRALACPAP